jgi:hypothetical protein
MGEAHNAIFAFERCLSVEPKNGPCRVQMARSHLALGETPNARAELATISEYNPPPEVQQLVARYLGAINTLKSNNNAVLVPMLKWVSVTIAILIVHLMMLTKRHLPLPQNIGSNLPTLPPMTQAYANLAAGASLVYKVSRPMSLRWPTLICKRVLSMPTITLITKPLIVILAASFDLETFQLVTKLQGQKMWLDGKSIVILRVV